MPKRETNKAIKFFKKQKFEPKTDIGGAFLPNHSGDHSAGHVLNTPVNDYDIANKKYVDDNSDVEIHSSDPTSPTEGQLIINSTSHIMKVYYEGSWRTLHTFSVADEFLLLEIGDFVLLENGDKIILE